MPRFIRHQKPLKPEMQEQVRLVNWLLVNEYIFTAIPNSTFTDSWHQKWLNKISGLRAGLPDMLIVLKRGALLFIEMKRPKVKKKRGDGYRILNDTSEAQDKWISILNDIDNVAAVVCYGSDEAIRAIEEIESK